MLPWQPDTQTTTHREKKKEALHLCLVCQSVVVVLDMELYYNTRSWLCMCIYSPGLSRTTSQSVSQCIFWPNGTDLSVVWKIYTMLYLCDGNIEEPTSRPRDPICVSVCHLHTIYCNVMGRKIYGEFVKRQAFLSWRISVSQPGCGLERKWWSAIMKYKTAFWLCTVDWGRMLK